MSNNNELSTKSAQSLQTECSQAIRKFGADYKRFLEQYPTLQKREDAIVSVYNAVERGGMSLVQIDNYFKPGASEYWIKVQLIDLFMVLGALESTTTYQFKAIAQRIRQEYYHITPSELTRYFYEFSLGDYGKLYVGRTVNPQDVLIGLKEYICRVYEKRAEIDAQKLAEKQKQEAIEAKKNAISWEEYCKRKGRDKTSNPLGGLQEKAKQESKRADNGERK